VAKFLDYLGRSTALLLINPDDTLLRSAKAMIRRFLISRPSPAPCQ
jgi:hypothetical protein